MEPKDIREGISYRCAGLYGSLVKALLNSSPESTILWYSQADRCLRHITRRGMLKRKSRMFRDVLGIIFISLRNRSCLAVVVAYPSFFTVSRIQAGLEYMLSLLALRIFSLGRIRVIIDDFDPPIEAAYAFSESKPSTLVILPKRVLDILSLKSASFIITVNESFKRYLAKIYHIEEKKILVVPNGSLIRYINCVPPKPEGPMAVLYSGSATKVKDIDKLLSTIAKLRQKGLNVNLHIAGGREMELPMWVHANHHDWPHFVNDVLSKTDVGVIPYPPNRLHFNYATPAKLLDFMAAGKPVVSTNLKETGKIIKMFNCGLVAQDWREFELHIERLYDDREFARKLGENGRKAAEKYFDYELLAAALLAKLFRMFEDEN
jgi:glycosyltransferase involved in cell wall biosynthesis